jgi:hypothetical protein
MVSTMTRLRHENPVVLDLSPLKFTGVEHEPWVVVMSNGLAVVDDELRYSRSGSIVDGSEQSPAEHGEELARASLASLRDQR